MGIFKPTVKERNKISD